VIIPLTDLLGYAAAVFVALTFSTRSMQTLRTFAVISNVCFIAYASRAELAPILILHAMLLPVNLIYLRIALHNHRAMRQRGERFGCLRPHGSAYQTTGAASRSSQRAAPAANRSSPISRRDREGRLALSSPR
jgi:hypothetical protein